MRFIFYGGFSFGKKIRKTFFQVAMGGLGKYRMGSYSWIGTDDSHFGDLLNSH